MSTDVSFEFPQLSSWRKARMLRYAQVMLQAQETILANTGQGILQYVLKDTETPEHMSHYPQGDRIDHKTGAQYFYHCHREDFYREEHGHFHCFLRYKQIPKHIKPADIADWDKHIDNPMTHLIAVAMNRFGEPIRLFTVNRWISEEIWYDAKHTPALINRFKMTLDDDPYWQVLDSWVDALLHLFAPQITWVLQKRDLFIKRQQLINPHENVYDDQRIEELSDVAINVKQQIQWVLEQHAIS